MSNRFHSKYHRKNHHTYGNATNPDASHDPIASPDQPFLGDFSLQGALCAVAPASAYAGYFYSSKTGVRTIGGEIGLAAFSFNTPLSTAFGKNIMHGTVGINTNSITPTYVLDVLGNTNLNGNLNVVGDVDIDGGDLSASTPTFNLLNTSHTTTINFGGSATSIKMAKADATSTVNIIGTKNSTSCTDGALVVDGGVGIAKKLNVCGGVKFNNDDESTSCETGALIVAGGVGIQKNLNVCGNATVKGDLTVLGAYTYLDTKVQVTSAMTIENTGTGPALKVTQTGNEAIAHFIDSDGDDIYFSNNGKVGLGTDDPKAHIHIYENSENPEIRIQAINDAHNPILRLAGNGDITSEGFYVQYDNNKGDTYFKNIFHNTTYNNAFHFQTGYNTTTEALTIKSTGQVGILTTNPQESLTVNGNISTNGNVLLNDSKFIQFGYGAVNDGGRIFFEHISDANSRLIFETIDNGNEALIFRQNDTGTNPNKIYNRLVIGTDGRVGIGTNTLTAIETFPQQLTVYGGISSQQQNYATGFRSYQGVPSNADSSINGYAFGSDGDTGVFSPIIGAGGASNGIVSLFTNNVEKLRADNSAVTVYGNFSVTGSITNDPKAPVTTAVNYLVSQNDHDKTILADHATTTINIQLPTGLKAGTQVSVIRVGAGVVQFAQGTGTPTILSTPNNDFKKLAFTNSAASAYWTGTSWYLVGDLLS